LPSMGRLGFKAAKVIGLSKQYEKKHVGPLEFREKIRRGEDDDDVVCDGDTGYPFLFWSFRSQSAEASKSKL
ncbi:unnamed protein product, partial [Dovyalis caffra]